MRDTNAMRESVNMTLDRRPDLEDARAVLRRAYKHYSEFREHIHPDILWPINESRDHNTGEWFCVLKFERARLISAKPIFADCANNIVSALDHVAAAIARANGHDRLTKLYFPMGEIDEKYAESLKMASKALGPQMTQVLSETRPKYHLEIQHVAAVKKVSNDGKHWKLVISTASAHAVAWNVPGSGQWIKQIPDDAFTGDNTFEFYRGNEPFNRDMYFVFKLEIEGLSATLPSGPEIILECALRYVEAVVAAVSAVEF